MNGQERDGWLKREKEMRKTQMDGRREREMREKWINKIEEETDG